MSPKEYAVLFNALSNPTRVQVVGLLTVEKQCACQILPRLNISQPTLSHHMRILCEAGLVIAEKNGKWVHYGINEATISEMKKFLESVGEAEVTLIGCPVK